MQNKINININNFGPINKADIDMNRINVIGGVNSSGKSFSSKLLFCFLTAVSKQGDKSKVIGLIIIVLENYLKILLIIMQGIFHSMRIVQVMDFH